MNSFTPSKRPWYEGGRRFDPYHLSANRTFPIRSQIGPFCADFRPLPSRILVSARVGAFWLRFLAPRLHIQKFRSQRLRRELASDRITLAIPAFGATNIRDS